MPRTKEACPMILKIILIAVYRHNSHNPRAGANNADPHQDTSLLHVFLPLFVTVVIWMLTCIPSVITSTRNPLGTIIHVVYGVQLACVYWTLVAAAVALSNKDGSPSGVGLLSGVTAASHFAWFCAPAHPDCIHGMNGNIQNIMRCCIFVILYSTLARSPALPGVQDGSFIITVWAPEIVNIIMDSVFNTTTSLILNWLDTSHDVGKDD